ncbi:hypothetical protein ACJX0J_016174, partial [Zea mays]
FNNLSNDINHSSDTNYLSMDNASNNCIPGPHNIHHRYSILCLSCSMYIPYVTKYEQKLWKKKKLATLNH